MTISLIQSKRADPARPVPSPHVGDLLCFALYSSSHAFSRRYKPLLAPLGITYPQYLCLLVLWQSDDVTVSTLGAELLLDSGTLTPLLKRMERAGLLLRVRDRNDERQVRIRLTDSGRTMQAAASHLTADILCATGRSMDEIARLRDELLAIRRHLDGETA